MKNLWVSLLLIALVAPVFAKGTGKLSPNLSSDAKNIINIWLDAQLAYEKIPYLSASYVNDQQTAWQGTFGHVDQQKTLAATESSIASVCSITKVFTATAVMKLVDEGKLSLDDKLSDILPQFTIQGLSIEDITVRTLLTHTSGLPRDTKHAYWSGPSHDFPAKDEFYQSVARQTRLANADTKVQYSNIGYALLGLIVESVSNGSYKHYIEREIFTPLGMDNSIIEMPESLYGNKHVIGYSALKRNGERSPANFYQTQVMQAVAGMSSNANDLAKFASWHFRATEAEKTDVVSAETLNTMYKLGQHDVETNRGIGFIIQEDKKGNVWAMHGGVCPGYTSFFKMNVTGKEAFSFVISANRVKALAYINNLQEIIARASQISQQEPVNIDLTQYEGFYDLHPWNSEYYVGKWGNELVLLYLPVDSIKYAMYHYRYSGKDTFQRVEEGKLTQEKIVFHRDKNGKVMSILNEGGIHKRR